MRKSSKLYVRISQFYVAKFHLIFDTTCPQSVIPDIPFNAEGHALVTEIIFSAISVKEGYLSIERWRNKPVLLGDMYNRTTEASRLFHTSRPSHNN